MDPNFTKNKNKKKVKKEGKYTVSFLHFYYLSDTKDNIMISAGMFEFMIL